jgi:Pyruvate/2-oxoacid:ferredoxin oxidoreductase delta subunit
MDIYCYSNIYYGLSNVNNNREKGFALKKEPKKSLGIKQDYCIGCGLCAELLPNVYEMQDNKAIVKAIPKHNEAQKNR